LGLPPWKLWKDPPCLIGKPWENGDLNGNNHENYGIISKNSWVMWKIKTFNPWTSGYPLLNVYITLWYLYMSI
jgi:hypothetical protein